MFEMTEWYLRSTGVRPARKGVYLTRFAEGSRLHDYYGSGREAYRYWDGVKWSQAVSRPKYIRYVMGTYGFQELDWRGLVNDPEVA